MFNLMNDDHKQMLEQMERMNMTLRIVQCQLGNEIIEKHKIQLRYDMKMI